MAAYRRRTSPPSLGAIRIDAMVLDGNDLGHAFWAAAGYTAQQNWSRWIKPVA